MLVDFPQVSFANSCVLSLRKIESFRKNRGNQDFLASGLTQSFFKILSFVDVLLIFLVYKLRFSRVNSM
jgi:hypothetical protein